MVFPANTAKILCQDYSTAEKKFFRHFFLAKNIEKVYEKFFHETQKEFFSSEINFYLLAVDRGLNQYMREDMISPVPYGRIS